MKKIQYLMLFMAIFMAIDLGAQSSKEVEIKLDKSAGSTELFSLGTEGCLLYYSQSARPQDYFYVTRYDFNLEKVWSKKILQTAGFYFREAIYDESSEAIYFVLAKEEKYSLIKLDAHDGDKQVWEFEIEEDFSEIGYRINQSRLVFSGMAHSTKLPSIVACCLTPFTMCANMFGIKTGKTNAELYEFDMESGQVSRRPPGGKKVTTVYDDVRFIEDELYYSYSTNFDQGPIRLKVEKLGPGLEDDLTMEVKFKTIEPVDVTIGKFDDEYVLTGGYRDASVNKASTPKRTIGSTYISSYSKGIYFSKYDERGNEVVSQHYKFSDIDSYKDYYLEMINNRRGSARKKEKLKKRVEETSALIHFYPVIQRDDDYLLITEFFHPVYHTESYTDANGVTHTRTVFDGFISDNFLIISFDDEGEILWDNFIDFESAELNYTFRPLIRMNQNDEDPNLVNIAYAVNSMVYKKVIEDDEIVDTDSYKLRKMKKEDKKVYEKNYGIRYLSDERYVKFGSRYVRKSSKKSRKKTSYLYLKVLDTDYD